MERYILQLVDDLRKAAKNAPKDEVADGTVLDDEQAFLDHIEQVELYTHGPTEKLSEIVGIPLSALPGDDKLTEEQTASLVEEMVNLLQAWNFYPDFPEGVPVKMLYTALLTKWESKMAYLAGGESHIELCNDIIAECPFPGYCDRCTSLNDDESNEMSEEDEPVDNPENRLELNKPVWTNTDEEGFIAGIYNYCDRWCERCDFTEVCRTFAMEKEFIEMLEQQRAKSEDDEPRLDADAPEDEISEGPDLEETGRSTGDDVPMDLGFDMNNDEFDDPRKDFFSAENKAERHALTVMADKYVDESHDWIEDQYNFVEKNFTRFVALGDTDELMDAFEVILRYHFFVPVKLRRALLGYFEQEDDDFEAYDMNGTAKVALIAMDDSIASLIILKRFFKDKKDILDNLIEQLKNLRIESEKIFPDARAFIRPGLDE